MTILLVSGAIPVPVPPGNLLDGLPRLAFGSEATPSVSPAHSNPPVGSVAPAGPGGSPAASLPSSAQPSPSSGPASPRTITVRSIPALLEAVADNEIDHVVVANGTYHVSESSRLAPDSLWIGGRFAARTRPITVRAETIGGVTFDGTGGGSGYGGLSFEDGAHDQTWIGFTFANMAADRSGIIGIAGYTIRRAPHHITLRSIRILGSCTGVATAHGSPALDHGVYIANALDPGPHDIQFDHVSIDGRGGLASAFHFFHSAPGAPNASRVTVHDLTVTGTQQAIMLWDPTLHDILFESGVIDGALNYAIRYETVGSSGIIIRDVTSSGSGFAGFYSSLGTAPAGISFSGSSLR